MIAQVEESTSMLRAMKLNAMANELERQFTERPYKEMSFGDRMDLIVTSEWNRRQTNKLNRYVKAARFSVPSATIENIEYHETNPLFSVLSTRMRVGMIGFMLTHLIRVLFLMKYNFSLFIIQ